MTQAAHSSPTSTSEAERARQVEEAVHSVQMEGLALDPADEADGAEYVAGRITLDEYGRRTRHRYGVPEEPQQGRSADPVAVYDAMREAGTSLAGSYVWLADHADRPAEADRWWVAYAQVVEDRDRVDPRDEQAQRRATADFIARERAVRAFVRA